MKEPAQFLWSLVSIAWAVLGFSGCVAALTAPLTALPLFVLTLTLLLAAPTAAARLRQWWQILTAVLLGQAVLFNLMMFYYLGESASKASKRSGSWRNLPAALIARKENARRRPQQIRQLRSAITMWLLALLPIIYLSVVLRLWRQQQESWALGLLLPVVLLLFLLLLLAVTPQGNRRRKRWQQRWSPVFGKKQEHSPRR